MPAFCSVMKCSMRGERDRISFFRFPAVLINRGDYLNALSSERRNAWIRTLDRGPLRETQLRNGRVCSRHFISGKPASLEDKNNPDWIPNQNMGYLSGALESISEVTGYKRNMKRAPHHGHELEMQKKALIYFMELEPNLCKGKFTHEFNHQVAKEKWMKTANRLNCIPGVYKDWIQWRRTWQDLKKQVKKKKLLPEVILTQDEEKLLSLVGDCNDGNEESKMKTEQLDHEYNQETIYVEYTNSHTDAGDSKSDEERLKDLRENHLEIEHYEDSEDKADQPSVKPNRTLKRKRMMTLAEKEFRAKESYFREKMMVMRRHYQERLKAERDNAKSRQRIACALENFVTVFNK